MGLTNILSKDIAGKLIIAPPSVENKFWKQSVIMITEHDKRRSVGIILNKPSEISIAELGTHIDIELDLPGYAHIGGPVSSQVLNILHTTEWSCKNTIQISDQFSISSSNLMLPRFSEGDTPEQWRIVAGLCGWGPNQLMKELTGVYPYKHDNSWCISSADQELVFEYNEREQWELAMEQSGIDFARNLLI